MAAVFALKEEPSEKADLELAEGHLFGYGLGYGRGLYGGYGLYVSIYYSSKIEH